MSRSKIHDLFWQVESGFFLEVDVKIVGKSIRDRVSLIKWRRQRIVRNGKTEESMTKTEAQNLLQVPSTGPPPPGLPSETEELQTEAVSLVCSAPTSATTATREKLDEMLNYSRLVFPMTVNGSISNIHITNKM